MARSGSGYVGPFADKADGERVKVVRSRSVTEECEEDESTEPAQYYEYGERREEKEKAKKSHTSFFSYFIILSDDRQFFFNDTRLKKLLENLFRKFKVEKHELHTPLGF